MDTLSTLLSDVRIRDARFIRTQFDVDGHLIVRDAKQPCYHIVTKGALWLTPGPGLAPIEMLAGDIAFFPQGQAHSLSGQNTPIQAVGQHLLADLTAQAATPGYVMTLPNKAHNTLDVVCTGGSISGCMLIDGVADAWLWGALPPYLLVRWRARKLPTWLQIGLAYLDQELDRDQLARQAILNRLGDILFIQSIRSYVDGAGMGSRDAGNPPANGFLMALKDSMVSKVIGAMHREPAKAWTLQELSSVGCVSRSVLAERFAELVGQPPLAYLTEHRMHLAARRLKQSSMPIAEVARSVGYQSGAAFAQAFKRTFECSPRAFRNRLDCP